MLTWLWAVLVFGLLIFVHELGHFLLAKRAGVGVDVFSLGFGPRLFWFRWGETECRVSAIPLGGYVRMVGENPDDEVAPEDQERSFANKSVWWRLGIVGAGPISNLILGFLAFFLIAAVWGEVVDRSPNVGQVFKSTPAAAAGLVAGDSILSVDGARVKSFSELKRMIVASGGKPVELLVERGKEHFKLTLKPEAVKYKGADGKEGVEYRIGIQAGQDAVMEPVPLSRAVVVSLKQAYQAAYLIVDMVQRLVTRKASMKEVGGPIFIAQAAEEAASRGAKDLIFLAGLISINLAILNLLPIPVLDGGHILFFLIEALIGRPVPISAREKAQQVGMLLLLALMAVVFYNDISRMLTAS